jgi:anti-sigma28 factor (negative regulator of flagellin synthesis)
MKVSLEQIEKVAQSGGRLAPPDSEVDAAVIRLTDADTVARVTAAVLEMSDREDLVERLRAEVEAGTYRPSAEDVVDAMCRRAAADRIR